MDLYLVDIYLDYLYFFNSSSIFNLTSINFLAIYVLIWFFLKKLLNNDFSI